MSLVDLLAVQDQSEKEGFGGGVDRDTAKRSVAACGIGRGVECGAEFVSVLVIATTRLVKVDHIVGNAVSQCFHITTTTVAFVASSFPLPRPVSFLLLTLCCCSFSPTALSSSPLASPRSGGARYGKSILVSPTAPPSARVPGSARNHVVMVLALLRLFRVFVVLFLTLLLTYLICCSHLVLMYLLRLAHHRQR